MYRQNKQVIITKVESGFNLPIMVTEILMMLENPEIDINRIQLKVKQDIALSSRLLSIANSSFYGFSGEIRSMNEAFMVLGTKQVKNIILTSALVSRFLKGKKNNLDLVLLWQHSLGTAVTASVLAELLRLDQETAFIAGMMHDIGKMVLDCCFPEDYKHVCAAVEKKECLILDAEKTIFELDHAAVGQHLLLGWHFPADICEAVGGHHKPDDHVNPITDVVHLADVISRALDIGHAGDHFVPLLNNGVIGRLKIDIDTVADLFSQIEQESQRVIAQY